MFDTWDWWQPNYTYDSGQAFDWNQIINRGLDVIGGRYSPGYISPDDPRYRPGVNPWGGQYPIGSGGGGYPIGAYPNPNTPVTLGGSVSLTTIALGVLVLVMLTRGGRR